MPGKALGVRSGCDGNCAWSVRTTNSTGQRGILPLSQLTSHSYEGRKSVEDILTEEFNYKFVDHRITDD